MGEPRFKYLTRCCQMECSKWKWFYFCMCRGFLSLYKLWRTDLSTALTEKFASRTAETSVLNLDHNNISHGTAHSGASSSEKGPQCQHQTSRIIFLQVTNGLLSLSCFSLGRFLWFCVMLSCIQKCWLWTVLELFLCVSLNWFAKEAPFPFSVRLCQNYSYCWEEK